MAKRSYLLIMVLSEIYCTSSYDHYIEVRYNYNGRYSYSRDYGIDGSELMGEHGMPLMNIPAYFERAIDAAILKRLKSGDYKVYEFDRDGNKRYTELRYHDDEWVTRTIARLEGEVGE